MIYYLITVINKSNAWEDCQMVIFGSFPKSVFTFEVKVAEQPVFYEESCPIGLFKSIQISTYSL